MTTAAETTSIGRYKIVSELGRGAMGVVYKANDPLLERAVAIKTVNMALERDGIERYEARFYQEARAAGGLSHPNIVTIYDIGKSGEIAYMAMEFIEGVELRSLIGEGRPLPVPQAVSIAVQVAEGLAYAHQRGIVHRDIKPPNIMIMSNGVVKITDFGIARMRASESLTQTGMMLGSPKYMSPEQVLGKRADVRSDIFSLGIILYEMLAGTGPFGGENVTALMYQIVNLAPPAPSVLNFDVPELLDYIVAKMLAKSLEERYQTAVDLARDLHECERLLAAREGVPPPPQRPSAALSTGPQASIVSDDARSSILERTFDRTRYEDTDSVPTTETLTRGMSRSFDSAEATQHLAALTGLQPSEESGEQTLTATQILRSVPKPERRGWRRRDWLVVGIAGLLGALVARGIVRGKRVE
ncbi:MAG: serine/threonine-protein kinase [Burkholderiales bacterium]